MSRNLEEMFHYNEWPEVGGLDNNRFGRAPRRTLHEAARIQSQRLVEDEEPETKEENNSETTNKEEPATDKKVTDEIKELKSADDYADFVKVLGDIKAGAFQNYLKDYYNKNSKLGKLVKPTVKEGTVACNKLKISQENIDIKKSIGLIADNPKFLHNILNNPTGAFTVDNPPDNPDGKLIVYGNTIIDGHHRWSKIFALNGPEAQVGIIQFGVVPGLSVSDMLKGVQLAIVHEKPGINLINDVKGANMLTCSEADVKAITDTMSDECLAEFKSFKPELDSKEKVCEHIWNNILAMRKAVGNGSGNPPRAVMPQTDKGPGAVGLMKDVGVIDVTESAKKSLKEDFEDDNTWLYDGKPIPDSDKEKITKVIIKDGLTEIKPNAFSGCVNLTEAKIPDSVTFLGYCAFQGCSSLKNITLGNGIPEIDGQTFLGCKSLTSVNIPNSVTTINDGAFSGCVSLNSITIGSGLTLIERHAFNDCYKLEKVNITDLAKWCSVLFRETEGSNPLYRAHNLFVNGELVTNLTIPSNVTTIKSGAFVGCSSIRSLTIPDSVSVIEDEAFMNCTQIAEINIGKGITAIGNEAFFGCQEVASINYNGSKEDWDKIQMGVHNFGLSDSKMHFKN